MLNKYEEKDFLKLKEVSTERLLPSNISVGLIGALFLSAAINGVLLYAVLYSSYINNPIWDFVLPICISLFIIQSIITLFFFNQKRAFAYQNFQSIFVCIVTFKVSVEGYIVYFAILEDRFAPSYFGLFAIIFLVSGLMFLILSILRAVKRVRDGHFRKGQKGLLDFKDSKSYVSLPIIFGATITGGAFMRMLSNSYHPLSSMLEIYFILSLMALLQFAIAVAWPEFFLLAYCKHRFKTFKANPPKRIEM